jgi:ribA/ribD-fused uncharacterized protein
MAAKARLFNDEEMRGRIMATDDPREMKALGKQVRGFRAEAWDTARHSIVLAGTWAKFTQDRALREFLLSTGDDVLVEASPLGTIWGIGLGVNNPRAADPRTWRGHNLLGFALMEVRDEIRRVYANADLLDGAPEES